MTAPSTMRAFGLTDGDLRALAGRMIAFAGYGNQGRAQALNLRDSFRAENVEAEIIASALRDETWAQAEADGFPVLPLDEAAKAAQVLFLLLPDEELPRVFEGLVAPQLEAGDAIVLASGYNLAFGALRPPDGIDVLLLAPRMIGRQLRQRFERGEGFYSYLSVERDASGGAWRTLLALAKGVGTLSPGGGGFELSARDEALLDLFHEQAFGSVIGMTFYLMLEVGAEAGLPPEALALDLYLSGEAAETFQAMAELGFFEQSKLHSRTSQYGGMMRSLAFDREPLRRHFATIIEDIKSGAFAERWQAERDAGAGQFERLRELAGAANPFTPIERRMQQALREAQERDTSS